MAAVVLGGQFGDEGKGKLVDILCASAQIRARSAGGNNASRIIVANNVVYDFHILPSGLLNPNFMNLVGSELQDLKSKGLSTEGRILILDRALVTFDLHTVVDGLEEEESGSGAVGYQKGNWTLIQLQSSPIERQNTRHFLQGNAEWKAQSVSEKRRKELWERLRPFVLDAVPLMSSLPPETNLLVEGANALMVRIARLESYYWLQ
ncbi:MAG: hypothetical protein Q9217_002402 [Psora testacea]